MTLGPVNMVLGIAGCVGVTRISVSPATTGRTSAVHLRPAGTTTSGVEHEGAPYNGFSREIQEAAAVQGSAATKPDYLTRKRKSGVRTRPIPLQGNASDASDSDFFEASHPLAVKKGRIEKVLRDAGVD